MMCMEETYNKHIFMDCLGNDYFFVGINNKLLIFDENFISLDKICFDKNIEWVMGVKGTGLVMHGLQGESTLRIIHLKAVGIYPKWALDLFI